MELPLPHLGLLVRLNLLEASPFGRISSPQSEKALMA